MIWFAGRPASAVRDSHELSADSRQPPECDDFEHVGREHNVRRPDRSYWIPAEFPSHRGCLNIASIFPAEIEWKEHFYFRIAPLCLLTRSRFGLETKISDRRKEMLCLCYW
jgi:hypothetical protein